MFFSQFLRYFLIYHIEIQFYVLLPWSAILYRRSQPAGSSFSTAIDTPRYICRCPAELCTILHRNNRQLVRYFATIFAAGAAIYAIASLICNEY